MLALAVSHAVFGPIDAFFAKLFGTRVRYSVPSVGFQLGALVPGAHAAHRHRPAGVLGRGSVADLALRPRGELVTLASVLLAAETFETDPEEEKAWERESVATS